MKSSSSIQDSNNDSDRKKDSDSPPGMCKQSSCRKRGSNRKPALPGGKYCSAHSCKSEGCLRKVQTLGVCFRHLPMEKKCYHIGCRRVTIQGGVSCSKHINDSYTVKKIRNNDTDVVLNHTSKSPTASHFDKTDGVGNPSSKSDHYEHVTTDGLVNHNSKSNHYEHNRPDGLLNHTSKSNHYEHLTTEINHPMKSTPMNRFETGMNHSDGVNSSFQSDMDLNLKQQVDHTNVATEEYTLFPSVKRKRKNTSSDDSDDLLIPTGNMSKSSKSR